MKKRWCILLMSAVLIAATLLPLNFLNAGSVNHVKNGDFSADPFTAEGHWYRSSGNAMWIDPAEFILLLSNPGSTSTSIWQSIDPLSVCSPLNLSLDLTDKSDKGEFFVMIVLYKDGSPVGEFYQKHYLADLTLGRLTYKYVPSTIDFNSVMIKIGVSSVPEGFDPYSGDSRADIDNVVLTCEADADGDDFYDSSKTEHLSQWVRDRNMTCYQVFINDAGNFEFVFFWEYKNNNWVKIYDMAGNEVFSIDMKYGNARFTADLPDGMYNVKTFNTDFEKPLQEFVIGKP